MIWDSNSFLEALGLLVLAGLIAGASIGCGSRGGRADGSGLALDGSVLAPETCEMSPAQPMSAPCCLDHGLDACGADLFCAAFDGRTVATCYAERSRADRETCTEDRHCLSGECHPTMNLCKSTATRPCTDDVGCAPLDGVAYECTTELGQELCLPATACSAGSTLCGGECVLVQTNPRHCGGCGQACANGTSCLDGACVLTGCPVGHGACGVSGTTVCMDLQSSPEHCGQCNNPCTQGTVCSLGQCISVCPPPLVFCAPDCVDIQTDANHCSGCARACASGFSCVSARCE